MGNLLWLTDAQMARLNPFFPKSHGKPRVDHRRVLSGIPIVMAMPDQAHVAHERHLCVDTTAAGGNAALLAG